MTQPVAYYNEIDPEAAAWLQELIKENLIAYGVVDTRSIKDVRPSDLVGFTQCHFFAGLGGWSFALRLAGVPDSYPVWTGSCPCQPFSEAGQGAGFDDERHLWPDFFWLIRQRRPVAVLGEQSASKNALDWLDLVSLDLEGAGYTVGAADTCAAGVGAPHIRQRLYWVGHTGGARLEGLGRHVAGAGAHGSQDFGARGPAAAAGAALRLAYGDGVRQQPASGPGLQADPEHDAQPRGGDGGLAYPDSVLGAEGCGSGSGSGDSPEQEVGPGPGSDRLADRLADAGGAEPAVAAGQGSGPGEAAGPGQADQPDGCGELAGLGQPGPTNGFWREADWLLGRDAKWRPVGPGTFPLATGVPHRVPLLRAAGNAINAEQAKVFIEAAFETIYKGN